MKSFVICRNCVFCVFCTNLFSSENESAEIVYEISSENESAEIVYEDVVVEQNTVNTEPGVGFDVWGSYIYWQPRQDFMDVALSAIPGGYNSVSGVSWSQGEIIEMPVHMASGFRAGMRVSADFCDVESEYIRLHTKNRIFKSAPSNGALFARQINPNIVSDNKATVVNATWKLEFDNLNIEMGKPFQAASRFVLQPKLGVAFAWISQHFESAMVLYDAEIPALPVINLSVKNQSGSLGVGPRIGMDGKLALWSSCRTSFNLVGHIAGDLLVTRYRLELNQRSSNEGSVFIHSRNVITVMQPEVELYFGLNYIYRSLYLELGYDAQVWFYQNMIRWYNDTMYITVPRGNFLFEGLRATLGFSF